MEGQREAVETVAKGKEQSDAVEAATQGAPRQIRRRGLLAATIALGAGAVAKLANPGPTEALDGDPLLVGMSTIATTQTILRYDGVGSNGLFVTATVGPAARAIYGCTFGSGNTRAQGAGGFEVREQRGGASVQLSRGRQAQGHRCAAPGEA